MTTYDSTLRQLETITRQTQQDGISAADRANALRRYLAKLRKHERKTEPYRTDWLDRIRAYETHINELSA